MEKINKVIHDSRHNYTVTYDPVSSAELIAPMEYLSKGRYMYEWFRGLSEEEISELCRAYKGVLSKEYLEFLRMTNGANLFGRYLSIAGMGYDPFQYRGCKVPCPIDMFDCKRTPNTPTDWLFIAKYFTWKGYKDSVHICLDLDKDMNNVYMLPRYGDEIIQKWESFESWFCEEHSRLIHRIYEGEYTIINLPGGIKDIDLS